MDDSVRSTHLHPAPAHSDTGGNLTTFLHPLVPPYFLKWGPNLGAWYAVVSLTGFLCHIIFMAFVIAFAMSEALDWLNRTADLPAPLSAIAMGIVKGLDRLKDTADLPAGFVLSFFSWWFVSSIWMTVMYRKHHDGTLGWRAYIFGGNWAWRFWGRGGSGGGSDGDWDGGCDGD